MKNVSIKINDMWLTDFDDIRCNASIFINNQEKANITASFDKEVYPDWENSQKEIKQNIKDNVDLYLSLPKISKCSSLLREIYDIVCESDATMCHISYEFWQEFYANKYTNEDIKTLKEEIKKYKLDNVITFDDEGYKIIGWGNLETSFNDDRHLAKNKERER